MVDITGAPSTEATTRLSGMQKGGWRKKKKKGVRGPYTPSWKSEGEPHGHREGLWGIVRL